MAATRRKNVSHKEHGHPRTKAANAKCRRVMGTTGQPWDGSDEQPRSPEDAVPMTRGQKAAETRRKNEALRERAERTEVLIEATERDEKGRFARLTPDEWRSILEDLDTASEWLVRNAALEEARLVLTLGGVTLEAVYHVDEGWTVGPVTG